MGRVYTFELRVEDIDTRGLLTGLPDLGGPTLEPGQEILVRYHRQDSAYQFLTRVIEYDHEQGSQMRIGFPVRITRYQRRKHTRSEVGGTVRFYPTGRENEAARGFIIDLSAGGVQFSTLQAGMFNTGLPAVGASITLDLILPDNHEYVGIVGYVRRVTLDSARTGNVRVQVEFTSIGRKTAEKLELISRRHARG